MPNADIQAAMNRQAYYKFLYTTIVSWGSDPTGYDLILVAHELHRAGDPWIERMSPDDFITVLRRCARKGATVPEPVPPLGAQRLRDLTARRQHRLHKEKILMEGQPLYTAPVEFRTSRPRRWQPVEPGRDGAATAQLVAFDRPDAPRGHLLFVGAEMGPLPGGAEGVWYRAYCKINRYPDAEVQILAEGTSASAGAARGAVTDRLERFLYEQCRLEDETEEDVYLVQIRVRLSRGDVAEVFDPAREGELRDVVGRAIRRHAEQRRKLSAKRESARQVHAGT